jgi:hypothetical protein
MIQASVLLLLGSMIQEKGSRYKIFHWASQWSKACSTILSFILEFENRVWLTLVT